GAPLAHLAGATLGAAHLGRRRADDRNALPLLPLQQDGLPGLRPAVPSPGGHRACGMTDGKVRLDKWLWAARFFKTRALAVEAIEGGKVNVNGERVKRAKLVQPGDRV